MPTHPPSPWEEPADPYGRTGDPQYGIPYDPQQYPGPYGQPYQSPGQHPYGRPYDAGQPHPDPYGGTGQVPYDRPHPTPHGQPPLAPYGQSHPAPYGQSYADPHGQRHPDPYGQQERPPRPDPYAELGRLDNASPRPAPPRRPDPYAELGRLDTEYAARPAAPTEAPVNPAASDPGYPPPEKPRRRRRLLGCLVVATVLVVGAGGVLAYIGMTTVAEAGRYELAPPPSFQGLSSDPSNALAKALAASNGEIAEAGATPALAAYSTHLGDRTPQLVLLGGYGKLLAPGTEVAAAWAGIDRSGGSVRDKTDEPSGKLGGTTQCAVTTAGPVEMPVCIWADNSTLAIVLFTGRMSPTVAHPDFAALDRRLLALRAVAEVKK
ncbi:hypothetical protein [Streptomyces sp. NPDC047990]|uniref:hypothetical protein n=1 Tax=Streptomyces sp. NPDC047990 TaxID=3365496 RepID=UPI003720BF54